MSEGHNRENKNRKSRVKGGREREEEKKGVLPPVCRLAQSAVTGQGWLIASEVDIRQWEVVCV
jgi:hypothetical protein